MNRQDTYDINLATRPATAETHDIRLSMTSKIWAYSTGMFALCIPLAAVMTREIGALSLVLPCAIVAGATGSTVAVWLFGSRVTTPQSLPAAHEQQHLHQLKQLDERLSNIETISSYERLAYAESLAPVKK